LLFPYGKWVAMIRFVSTDLISLREMGGDESIRFYRSYFPTGNGWRWFDSFLPILFPYGKSGAFLVPNVFPKSCRERIYSFLVPNGNAFIRFISRREIRSVENIAPTRFISRREIRSVKPIVISLREMGGDDSIRFYRSYFPTGNGWRWFDSFLPILFPYGKWVAMIRFVSTDLISLREIRGVPDRTQGSQPRNCDKKIKCMSLDFQ